MGSFKKAWGCLTDQNWRKSASREGKNYQDRAQKLKWEKISVIIHIILKAVKEEFIELQI